MKYIINIYIQYIPHEPKKIRLTFYFLHLTRLLLRLKTLWCVFCIYLRLISGRTMQAAEPELTLKWKETWRNMEIGLPSWRAPLVHAIRASQSEWRQLRTCPHERMRTVTWRNRPYLDGAKNQPDQHNLRLEVARDGPALKLLGSVSCQPSYKLDVSSILKLM